MIGKFVRTGMGTALAASFWLGIALAPALAAQKVAVAFALTALPFSWAYVADGMGFWKDEGLDVEQDIVGGPGATQALVAGDAQFAPLTGAAVLTADAHGQPLIGIAAIHQRLMNEIVISKAAAAKTGLTVAGSTVEQRAKALKGLTLAIDNPNTILDAYLKHALTLGGLDPEKDAVRTPIQPPAVNPAMEAGKIDGFSMTPPWTTMAEQKGTGVIWISSIRGDLPDLQPFVFSLVAARSDYCEKNADICTKFVTGVQRALAFMISNPEKSLELVAPKFANMDPTLLKIGFDQQRALLVSNAKFTDDAWRITQKFSVEAGLMKPSEQVPSFEGKVYSNAYAK